MFLTKSTFSTGFAKNAAESAYPELWKDLVGFWNPAMGKQGLSLYDFSGKGHKGTLNSIDPSSAYVVGKYGYALNYTGSSTFVDCGTIPEIDDASKNLTLIFMMRSSATASQTLITYDNNAVLQPSVDWYCYCANVGNLKIGGFGSTTELDTGITSASLRDGKWHQVAIILKQTTIEVYVDSVLRYNPANTKTHSNFGSSFILQFGAAENVASYVGDLGEISLYNIDLPASQIRNIYLGASPLTLDIAPTKVPTPPITVTLATLDTVSSVIAPTISISSTFSASTLDTPSSIIAPTNVGNLVIITPSTLDAPSSIITPIISISSTISVSTLNAPSSIITPVASVSSTFLAATLAGVSSVINPTIRITGSTKFGVKILSINPLIFVSNDTPPKIINVDTTIPTAPIWTLAPIAGITTVYDAYINTTNNFVYVAADSGKVIKIEISDLFNQTTFNTSDADNISTIDGLPLFGLTYAGTDQNTGELYVIDERNTFAIDSDFEALSNHFIRLNSDFRLIHAFKLDSEFTVLSYNKKFINSDFKCLTNVLDTINPIKQSQIHLFIDNVEVIDPDLSLDSIQIVHTIDNESSATFKLNRRHDDINRNLFGTSIPISSQNTVRIEIDGHIEFDGKIGELDCQYNTSGEQINVTAYQAQPVYQFNNVTLSLPSLNQRLGLYDILIQNPRITNPYIDPNSTNPKKYLGIKANLGQKKTQDIKRFVFINSGEADAAAIQNGTFNPIQNWTYFWGVIVEKLTLIDTVISASDASTVLLNNLGQPIVDNGDKQTLYKVFESELGGTNTKYFPYIGTSLSPVSSNLWFLKNAYHSRQRVYPDIIEELGDYTVGVAPFKNLSIRNGQFISKFHWEDRADGKYSIQDASYDYRQYVQRVADLEYQKLLNINGTILPETRCTMNIGFDAYYYYGLKLLTRINVDNTTVANTYKQNNGFPTSIKSITISSSDMSISLQTDNLKSNIELDIIDKQFPDENSSEFVFPEVVLFNDQKADMNTGLSVT